MKLISVRDGASSGYHNMAADCVAMRLVEKGSIRGMFRTYSWRPHCLSIGRFQRPEREADVRRLLADGYHMVRRPTGGRAVWHGDELTYSIVMSRNEHLVSGSTEESLRRIAAILLEALRSLGIPAVRNEAHRKGPLQGRDHNPCFLSRAVSEIVTPDGRKLVGSAQARTERIFLEHGSILLGNDQPMAAEYLPEWVSPERRALAAGMLSEGVGTVREFRSEVDGDMLADALHRRFAEYVGDELEPLESCSMPGVDEETKRRRSEIG